MPEDAQVVRFVAYSELPVPMVLERLSPPSAPRERISGPDRDRVEKLFAAPQREEGERSRALSKLYSDLESPWGGARFRSFSHMVVRSKSPHA